MTFKKKIYRVCLMIFGMFTALLLAFPGSEVKLSANKTETYEITTKKSLVTSSSNPTLSVTSAKSHTDSYYGNNGYDFAPDTSGNIYISLTLQEYTDHDVIIYFHASDGTAVSEAGDYYYTGTTISSSATNSEKAEVTHQQSSIVIQAGKLNASVNYKTSKTSIVPVVDGKYCRSYFYFCIDEITGASYSQNEYTCGLDFNTSITTQLNGQDYSYDAYFLEGYHVIEFEEYDSWTKTWSFSLFSNKSATTVAKYYNEIVTTGLGNVYTKIWCAMDSSFLNTGDCYFKFYPSNNRSSSKQIASWTYDCDWNDYDKDGYASAVNGRSSTNNYIKLNKEDGYEVYTHIRNIANDVIERDGKVTYTSYFIDSTTPQISGYYVDASNIKTTGKVNLAVRFTEPVQINGNCAIRAEYITGTTIKELKFNYFGGEYSNTLLFQTDLTTLESGAYDKLITSFNFNEFEGISSVRDFARNFSGTQNKIDNSRRVTALSDLTQSRATCNIDLRIPEISQEKGNTTDIVSMRQLDLTISKMADGMIYYSWRKENDLVLDKPSDYDYSFEITNDKKSTHEITITGANLTGEYYLYILARSGFGKTKTIKLGRAKSDGKIIGGFLFDNAKPTIDSSSLAKDDLKEKVFEIVTNDGNAIYDSQISQIYMYYAKDKNVNKPSDPICIYSSGVNEFGLTRYGYELGDSNLYFKSTINDEIEKITGYSLENYLFSSKEAAIEFVTLCEYYDLTIEKKFYDESFDLAAGETKSDKDYAYYIRYKASDFNYNNYNVGENSNRSTISHKDYVYYLYSGDDLTKIDLSLLSQNLLDAIKNNAEKVVNNGTVVDLIAKGYLNDDYSSITSSKKTFLNTVSIATIPFLSNAAIKDELTYKDKKLKMTSAGGSYLFSLTAEDLGLVQGKYGYFTVWFVAVDNAGNSSVIPNSKMYLKYDTRRLFDSSLEAKVNNEVVTSIDNNVQSYDVSKGPIDMTFKTLLSSEDEGLISIKALYYQNAEDPIPASDYFDYISIISNSLIESSNNSEITIRFTKPGYYKLEFVLMYGSNPDINNLKQSVAYEFYITNSFTENTLNYSNINTNSVLTNQVFQLGTDYYYLDLNNKIQQVTYNYVYKLKDPEAKVSTLPASFSSKSVATNYVRYMEQLDFYLLVLNPQTAENLNNGVNKEFVKADGEVTTAATGQVWIRYKRRTWTCNSTEYDWVYYYYGEAGSTTLSISNISSNLSLALDDVVTYIVNQGYITNLVGTDHTDKYGAPYLEETQKHVEKELSSTTLSGSTCSPLLEYKGDADLYDNKITYSDGNISTIMTLSSNALLYNQELNHIYYAYYNGSISESELTFTELSFQDAATYRNAINGGTGVYVIREFGKEGANQYRIYIDNTAPCVQVSYKGAMDSVIHTPIFDSSSDTQTYSAKTFSLGAIDLSKEKDESSYVAVYTKKTRKLINVYYADYLESNFVDFETGEYYIVVSDRSGNSYSFNVYVNDTELEVKVEIVDNDYVQVSINRTEDQIYLYEVYLNGNPTPIDKVWTGSKKKYRESGFYQIIVRDIYGFSKEIGGESGYSFERDLPDVTWSYLGDDNAYHKYEDGVTSCMNITYSLGTDVYINTSKTLRFTLNGDYGYVITGLEKNEITEGFLSKVVTINSTKNWEVEIYYLDYPDIKVHYICSTDDQAPEISLTYKVTSYSLSEVEYMAEHAESAKDGDIYVPKELGYEISKEVTTGISNGKVVNSNLIKLAVEDASGISNIQIYLDDVLLNEYKDSLSSSTVITLSRYGKYKIIATDIFGNNRTVSFENNEIQYINFTMDGIDEEERIEETIYGHDNSTITFLEDGLCSIKYTDSENNSYVYLLNIEDYKIIKAQYVCEEQFVDGETHRQFILQNETYKGINSAGEVIDIVSALFDAYDVEYHANKWYKILDASKDGFNLYASFDTNKTISIKVESSEERAHVEYRVSFGSIVEPYYYDVYLSQEITNAIILDENGDQLDVVENGLTYINNTFTFDENINSDIESIEISYSDTREFTEYETIYPVIVKKDNEEVVTLTQYDTSKNGFYSINITNIYGNKVNYLINRSDIFVVLAEASYDDGAYSRFNEKYDSIIKSNSSIAIEAYTDNGSFVVYKDGALYEPSIMQQDGYYYINFVLEGTYQITCIDNNYGNVIEKTIIIQHSNLEYFDDMLEGYNPNALIDKTTVYTNKSLSVNEESISKYNIKYISITYNDEETVIYDNISQNVIDLNTLLLADCIGQNGSGLYTITFRDEFGSVASKQIDYRSEDQIVVSRTIRSSSEAEACDITDVITNGIYSNGSITVESCASKYKVYVDNEECILPYQFSLAFQSGSATIVHKVTYKDEYGFEYSFDVTLHRKDLILNIDSSVKTVEIDNVITTKDNVKLSFVEGECSYTLDGGKSIPYTSDTVLRKDGYYRFTLQDKAGNIATQSIRKDTYVDFSFVDMETGIALTNKTVVNNGPVEFMSNNKDQVTIKSLYIDGVKSDSIPAKFKEHGHYVLLLSDEIGNEVVFEFYLLTHEISQFSYKTPDSYLITDVWYSSGDGNFISYMNSGAIEQYDNYSTINLTENGMYQVTMTSSIYSNGLSFVVEVNNSAPKVRLVGVEEGKKTLKNVTIEGFTEGDTIEIYKDGTLISTTIVKGTFTDSPVMDEGGKYEVVVTNRAGVSTILTFERKHIANNSGSALIILLCLGVSIGMLVGVVLRNKQKFDN